MRHGIVVLDDTGTPVLLQEEHLHYVDAWEKKSSASDSPSTSSSRLSKDRALVHHLSSSTTDNTTYEDTPTKTSAPAGSAFRTGKPKKQNSAGNHGGHHHHPHGNGTNNRGSKIRFGPLKSSTLKKSSSESSLRDIYAVPKKNKKLGLKRKSSSVKYINEPGMYRQDFVTAMGLAPYYASSPPSSSTLPQMFERNPSFREGMKGEGESRFPIHTLDPSALPGAHHHLQGPDVYDHVMSFRSYPSPEQSRKERVVYLYPGHPGYHRLYKHGHEDALQSDRASLHSSRSSLVKL